jgi:flagellar biosynthesis protein FliQ
MSQVISSFLMEPDRLATIIIVGPFLIAAMFVGLMVHLNEE